MLVTKKAITKIGENITKENIELNDGQQTFHIQHIKPGPEKRIIIMIWIFYSQCVWHKIFFGKYTKYSILLVIISNTINK